MIVDFHTHVFPSAMAEKTIQALYQAGNMKPYTDGTLDGLKRSMEQAGIDLSVVLPVMTRQGQFSGIHAFAEEINCQESRVLSFGGIHPEAEDFREEIKKLKVMGFAGIKIHPDYQKTYIDDIRYLRILDLAAEEGLIVVTHAGFDPISPDRIHASVERIEEVLRQVDSGRLVLAHIGGMNSWDAVEERLAGANVYFDLSQLPKMDGEQFRRICRKHGAGRLLFASDSPWVGQEETLRCLQEMQLTEEENRQILGENALGLLGRL